MFVQDFPACCAYWILNHFGGTNVAEGGFKQPLPANEIEKFLITKEELAKSRKKALLLIAINEDQRTFLRPILFKLGWKRVSRDFHPNHKSWVYLYKKSLNFQPEN